MFYVELSFPEGGTVTEEFEDYVKAKKYARQIFADGFKSSCSYHPDRNYMRTLEQNQIRMYQQTQEEINWIEDSEF